MKIVIGSDHAGYLLKEKIKTHLQSKGFDLKDVGSFSEESVDYPDLGHKVAEAVLNKESDFGIAICGSGNGINITVNKHKGIRAALCWTSELASLARQHNDANILSLPARFISEKLALEIVDAFFAATFEGGRHQKRIDKI
jgi:ribose 5-phosphate isomerase B